MKIRALVLLSFAYASALQAADWPQFRGPNADGAYSGPKLPTEWGTDKNVVWKQAIPGQGWSSPIVYDGKVYLTTAVAKSGGYSLQALCVNAADGKIDWTKEIFVEPAGSPKIHSKNSHASPTPITDGQRLYVHFGHMGTAALDLKGNIIWAKNDLKYLPQHGNGGSPILAGDNLVFSIDGNDKQVVAARNKKTGAVVWQTDRRSKAVSKFSFSTPLLLSSKKGEQIISPASGFVGAYDPKTGSELWRASYPTVGPGYSVIPQPVAGHGLVFVSTSYNTPFLLAVKPEGKGDVTASNIAWTMKKGAPHTPTPLLVGDELYVLADNGNFSCLDAKSGTVHWSERLADGYSASPIHADGNIYIISEKGTGYVVAADKTFKEISKNQLNERTFATFAAADGALYIRTESQLYRFEEKNKK